MADEARMKPGEPTEEEVEVARALVAAEDVRTPFDQMEDYPRTYWLQHARAAIAAVNAHRQKDAQRCQGFRLDVKLDHGNYDRCVLPRHHGKNTNHRTADGFEFGWAHK